MIDSFLSALCWKLNDLRDNLFLKRNYPILYRQYRQYWQKIMLEYLELNPFE